MAHEIFGERFVSRGEPAWHRLGHVVHDPLSANAGFDLVGRYHVGGEPVYRRLADGGFEAVPFTLLKRHATEDAAEQVWNVVSDDYGLITPDQFVDLWDNRVRQPIETLGALRDGRQLFITTHLPEFSVAGDDCKNYLIALNGMDGAHGAKVIVSPVRVVCANTLRLSEDLATESYVMQHTEGVHERLGAWMEDVYATAAAKTAAIREACELLAAHQPTKAQVSRVIEIAFPARREHADDVPVAAESRRATAVHNKAAAQRREVVLDLFEGAGTGMDTKAAKRTLWGLYNCVVEVEDYRRGPEESAAVSLLSGPRAQTKSRAFEACMKVIAKG